MVAYYSENDPYAAAWLRNLIAAGLVPAGDVDDRDIRDVCPDDLRGYGQVHCFAGIGGWGYAARLAGWPDDRPIWTGSAPCQPFSVAGRGKGTGDERHLWPDFFRLIRAARPAVVMGEQVAGAAGYGWLDGVRADLAGAGYASRAVDIPACAVDAPHIRSRLYWIGVADRDGERFSGARLGSFAGEAAGYQGGAPQRQRLRSDFGPSDDAGDVAYADGAERRTFSVSDGGVHRQESRREQSPDRVGTHDPIGRGLDHADSVRGLQPQRSVAEQRGRAGDANAFDLGDASGAGLAFRSLADKRGNPLRHEGTPAGPTNVGCDGSAWADAEWIACHDGKARRTQPRVPLLAHGIPDRVALWRGFGNAICAPLAAEVIAAFMECEP